MEVISIAPSNATIVFELNELLIIKNTLTEVLDYLGDDEFHTRTGFHMHEGEQLFFFMQQEIMTIKNNIKIDAKENSNAIVSISKDNLFLVKAVFNEIINGYEVVDFDNRIGASEDDAKILYEKVQDCTNRVRRTLA